jgi:fructose-1,6-bisphosphatase/inositol monophosphatase family enzyme
MTIASLLPLIRTLHRRIQRAVLEACRAQSVEHLSSVASDSDGDTIYAIDKVSEELLLEVLELEAERYGGIVLIAEGLSGGKLTLPRGTPDSAAAYRMIVDPIDGTRGLMYQKRSAWILTGVAENVGPSARLSDVVLAVQTEIPTLKQNLADELWASPGEGVQGLRVDVSTGHTQPLFLRPSRARSIEHGFAMLSRFFPGAREELAAIDDELCAALVGHASAGKALCFEDQYASSGGQLYELSAGHDRFNADLRPLLQARLVARGVPLGLCCHPYDVCTALIARELGVIVTAPDGAELNPLLDVESDVAWVGYANAELRAKIEPVLQAILRRRGLLS